MAKLSVIIPVYNMAAFAAQTGRSVLEQTLQDLEIIIVDDGSTDCSLEVCRQFAGNVNVTLITQANAGVSAARNRGLREARGDYVAFLDADDLWHPEKAARQCAVLDQWPEIDITWSDWRTIDEKGDAGRRSPPPPMPPGLDTLLVRNFTGNPSTVIARRSAVDAAHGFDEHMRYGCEDWDLWLRIAACRRGSLYHVPGVLTAYRRYSGQMSGNWRKMQQACDEIALKAQARWPETYKRVKTKASAYQYSYLAYLALEAGDRGDAARLMLSSWSSAPWLMARSGRTWRLTAAVLASQIAPQAVASGIRGHFPWPRASQRVLEWLGE
jgi:glycosyltransferase involved in cell wall biosynthesis